MINNLSKEIDILAFWNIEDITQLNDPYLSYWGESI
jgi:hypothetical protein